jgi:RND family efflux transporter MFP subunit
MVRFGEMNLTVFRRVRLSAVVLTAATAFLVSACEEETAETIEPIVRPVVSIVVADVERFITDRYPGRARAVREVNISFEVPGKIIKRPVDVGSEVKQGDVMATLDPGPYVAGIRALEGERAALEAALSNAETELDRREKLFAKDFVAQANVDDQIMMVRAAEAKIEAVDGALDAARLNLGYTNLEAPFDGTISQVFAENFQNVLAKQPVLRLLDTSRIEMEASVPERYIGFVPYYVKEITVTFSSLPGLEIPAEITNVGTEASQTTRTYPVTIVMDQPDGGTIQPGMAGTITATVELPPDWAKSGIEVPSAAVFSPNEATPDQFFIWVVDEATETVSMKSVELISMGERGLLVSGLDAGDRIVIAGVSFLTEGQKVRIPPE